MSLLHVKTLQAASCKSLIESLKELLSETNIHASVDGLKILDMDDSHTVLVNLMLDANAFEVFHCDKPIIVGVNLTNLNRIFKTIRAGDVLEIMIDHDSENDIKIRLSNESKGQIDYYEIHRIELDDSISYEIPNQDYEHIISMPANDFQQICCSSKSVATQTNNKVMDITSYNQELTFTVEGDVGRKLTKRQGSSRMGEGSLTYTKSDDMIYQGQFNLEKLIEFSKCAALSQQNIVQIMMKNNIPIIFNYPVASLGRLVLILAPREEMEDNI